MAESERLDDWIRNRRRSSNQAARRAYDVAQKLVYQSGLIPEDERREFLAQSTI